MKPTGHRPVDLHQHVGGTRIRCLCGWKSHLHRWPEDAWDEYDDHTMKD